MKTTDPAYIAFNEKYPQHTLMEYVHAALEHLASEGNPGYVKLKAHFDDPDSPGEIPPARRFAELLRMMEDTRERYPDVDFWKPCYPGYETLIRVRDYVRTFRE